MPRFIGKAAINTRVRNLIQKRSEMASNVNELHVQLRQGNCKTGVNCWTVSLLPVVDCCNCAECKYECYDIKSDMIYPNVVADRCKNSAIHKADIKRYWDEIDMQIKANFVTELRLNVGGDLNDDDFPYVAELGRKNPKTMIMFFTKNYKGINLFLEQNEFPENVHPIMSAWENTPMDNPNNLPCSHVLYEDGKTTAPSWGSIYCSGNCSECAYKGDGCWNLKKGEHVIFHVH